MRSENRFRFGLRSKAVAGPQSRTRTKSGPIFTSDKDLSLPASGMRRYWSKLADAQELVARQMDFDEWQALNLGADAMIDEPRQTTPHPVLSSKAQLFVASIKSSCDFYTDKLEFAV